MKTSSSQPELLRQDLIRLLTTFQNELENEELRAKVQALIPVHLTLNRLGISLIPHDVASGARDRILHYLLKYPHQVIPGDELMIVAGISEWARRVRELRVQFGWRIITGNTVREMADENEFILANQNLKLLAPDDYILVDIDQDLEAAYRWNIANDIRKTESGVRDKILSYLKMNLGKAVSGEELRYVANDASEWARRIRELRSEYGWPIVTKQTGRPDLPVGVYVLEEDRQSPEHDRRIPDSVRGEVLRRDHYQCQRCSWSHSLWNRSDARHLELHHIHSHAKGGTNTFSNLITLCTRCHDRWHAEETIWTELQFDEWLKSAI